ncbi:MAG: hypothetical protein ACR2QM_10445 [Longimicrobiales bacterium]
MNPDTNNQNTPVKALATMALLGGLILSVGALMSTMRVWSNLLIGLFFLVSVGLGGSLFIALTTISGASWHRGLLRIPRALASTLPITSLGLLVVLLLQMNEYAWHHHGHGDAGTYWFKEWWTNPSFWAIRTTAYLAIWVLLSRALLAVSAERKPNSPSPLKGPVAALFLVVYAVTFSLASCDWFMLLDPMWFSTIWGVYHFAGMFQSTLAVMIIVGLVMRSRGGPLKDEFTIDHLHDLGRLLLGFSCFWMYIWFSQYMLIWYTNIPEETSYFDLRTAGPWGPVMVASIILNWIIPFFVLLPRPCKRSSSVMMKIAVVVLIGRAVDLYTIVFPRKVEGGPVFGLWEAAAAFCLIGCFWLLISRAIANSYHQTSGKPKPTTASHPCPAGALPNA